MTDELTPEQITAALATLSAAELGAELDRRSLAEGLPVADDDDPVLRKLRTLTTAADVFRTCPPKEPRHRHHPADGHFVDGRGLADALAAAGWERLYFRWPSYWCMRAPNGDPITNIDGSLYRARLVPMATNPDLMQMERDDR